MSYTLIKRNNWELLIATAFESLRYHFALVNSYNFFGSTNQKQFVANSKMVLFFPSNKLDLHALKQK